jgi:zinc transport system substrate-binding protein
MPLIQIRVGALLLRILQTLAVLLPCSLVQAQSLKLVTSIRPLALLAQDLTQGLPVTVAALLPANADPHSWALRISDRQTLEDADLVLWLGPEFEVFLTKPLAGGAARQVRLGELPGLQWTHPEGAAHSQEHHDHGHHTHTGRDLHVWLNPANAAEIQKALVAGLAGLRPDWQEELQRRLQQQLQQLEQLQADIHQRLSPHRQKGFIAYHDAYGHFVEAFGLHQLGAVNQSSEQRLSAKVLHELQMHARSAHCLMVEKSGAQEQRLAQTLNLPVVIADGLAADSGLQDFAGFLLGISAAFESCALAVRSNNQ